MEEQRSLLFSFLPSDDRILPVALCMMQPEESFLAHQQSISLAKECDSGASKRRAGERERNRKHRGRKNRKGKKEKEKTKKEETESGEKKKKI